MTTLSELVKFRNDVELLRDRLSLKSEIDLRISLLNQLGQLNQSHSDRLIEFITPLNQLRELEQQNIDSLSIWINDINTTIEATAKTIAQTSITFNADTLTSEVGFNYSFNEHNNEVVMTRIRSYCDWHYPALQIGCRFKQWVDCMVTADPLYLTAYYNDVVNQVVETYPQLYQQRLRVYPISINSLTKELPLDQFSFILAWEVFNYSNPDEIANTLSQALALLRPGGTFMFSYNNCDLSESAHLYDIQAMTYSRKSNIIKLCQSMGYEVKIFEDIETGHDLYKYISWGEVSKPGQLTTSKAHQILGKIVEK